MRTVLSVIALLLIPSAAAADPSQVAIVSGSAAIATFEQISDDGCVITIGEIAVVEAQIGGELQDGLYVVGSQEDICLGTGNGFAGFTEGDGGVLGLVFARFTGTIVAESYSGGAPVTLELDLRWVGYGAVSTDGGVFHDEGSISFTFQRTRAAATYGDFTVDGADATVTSATLLYGASGSVTL